MALVPVGPAGLLDSLYSSRSLHGHTFALLTSLQSRKYKKFQCFCSHGALNVENSEYPHGENHDKRKQLRFRKNYMQDWKKRPIVKRTTLPWEEKQEEKETEKERANEGPVAVNEKNKVEFGGPRSLPVAPWTDAWNKSSNEGVRSDYESEADDDPYLADEYKALQAHLEGPHEKTAMEQIKAKLRKFRYPVEDTQSKLAPQTESERGLIDEMFPEEEPGAPLPNTKSTHYLNGRWSGAPIKAGKDGPFEFPWDRKDENSQGINDGRAERRLRLTRSVAELTIPEPELNRLRGRGIRLKDRIKLGSAGVTRAIVDTVHEKWRNSEIVKFKCEGSSALNMRRTHELLEKKTGGLVIWRSGGSIVLYRGMTYESPSLKAAKLQLKTNQGASLQSETSMPSAAETIIGNKPIDGVDERGRIDTLGRDMPYHIVNNNHLSSSHGGTEVSDEKKSMQSPSELDYQSEMNKILDELGPRFTDWSGCDPLPVDADLLPKLVPGYKEPFRLLPYGMRSSLGNMELTNLRRLARRLPPHFALGRNRQHQGLAAAIVKLWEKSAIAKIAIKRGVLNTSNERMAEELKNLTGGTILSRNKEFIVIYRGKDFLSPSVAAVLQEREALARELQEEEEMARLKASSTILDGYGEVEVGPSFAGTLAESLEAKARWSKHIDSEVWENMRIAAARARKADIARKLDRKLDLAQKKVGRAERELAKVEALLMPAKRTSDQEMITDEERFMFRKLALRMHAFLLLGRRGIFDGTVENMHLHWKHRELVKIISKERSLAEVKYTALMLEAESGGILVSVDKVSKGYAIIVYRGKNYQRPLTIKPKNLLTKRRALKRSIELQRREALNRHMLQLQKNMEQLKFELSRIEDVDENQSTAMLNAELNSAYLSEGEESEDEDAYEDPYDSEDEDESSELEGGSPENHSTAVLNAEFNSAYLLEGAESEDEDAFQDPYDSEDEDRSSELERGSPENQHTPALNAKLVSAHLSEDESEYEDAYHDP